VQRSFKSGRRGNQRMALKSMFRIYCMQNWSTFPTGRWKMHWWFHQDPLPWPHEEHGPGEHAGGLGESVPAAQATAGRLRESSFAVPEADENVARPLHPRSTAVFLIAHTVTVIHHTAQHQGRLALVGSCQSGLSMCLRLEGVMLKCQQSLLCSPVRARLAALSRALTGSRREEQICSL
jgi:hypothetical protein